MIQTKLSKSMTLKTLFNHLNCFLVEIWSYIFFSCVLLITELPICKKNHIHEKVFTRVNRMCELLFHICEH